MTEGPTEYQKGYGVNVVKRTQEVVDDAKQAVVDAKLALQAAGVENPTPKQLMDEVKNNKEV